MGVIRLHLCHSTYQAFESGFFRTELEVRSLPSSLQSLDLQPISDVSQLLGGQDYYGSYQSYANLSVAIDGVTSSTTYNRSLNFDTGIHTTIYTANDGNVYSTAIYCTYPDQVCVYDLLSSAALPQITISLENQLTDSSLFNATCGDQNVRLAGFTQLGPPLGMKYDGIARLITRTETAYCSNTTARALVIPAGSHIRTLTLVIGASTNYDQLAGNAASDFSFKGEDPGPYVEAVTSAASLKPETDLNQAHVADYRSLASLFFLDLPDTAGSAGLETSVIIDRYAANGTGDPYLESTLFALGRHLFISSERPNSLPANLQGRWSQDITGPWGCDYHANINFQMNYWGVDMTGLGDLQVAIWNYIQNTWVPRGTETAQLLYDAPGWVLHDEINIFGHTAMKYSAQWADYPASAAWMMQHIYDHYTYSLDATWFLQQGYPLMKGIGQFWISQLQPDQFFNDGTLVVNPCNSPEHGPTTFACTHYQQLLHQLFTQILSIESILPSSETEFLSNITTALKTLDKGLHIGVWGEVKEWKLPDSWGYDFENDTHRHLSNLIGWYPGYSSSSYLSGYTNSTIQSAVATTLYSRGPGDGADADSGWEKLWRSACWSMLNNTDEAYNELRFAIDENFAGNGLSMYWALIQLFQIDANFGLVGAMLAMLIVDLPGREEVVLGPAIPAVWGGGSVQGLRLRGGGSVDFSWNGEGVVRNAHVVGRSQSVRIVNVLGEVVVES
jgi:alpha-L-fucosidase 2